MSCYFFYSFFFFSSFLATPPYSPDPKTGKREGGKQGVLSPLTFPLLEFRERPKKEEKAHRVTGPRAFFVVLLVIVLLFRRSLLACFLILLKKIPRSPVLVFVGGWVRLFIPLPPPLPLLLPLNQSLLASFSFFPQSGEKDEVINKMKNFFSLS